MKPSSFLHNKYLLMRSIGILLLCMVIGLTAFRQDKPLKLFLLGDSISLQYGTYLEKYLKGKFTIDRKGSQEKAMQNLDIPVDANGGDSKMVLDYLRTRENDTSFQPDLMLLNCGLHDIKRHPATHKIAVDSISYRENLEAIYQLLSRKKIPLVWVRSTDILDSLHAAKSKAFDRYAKDIVQYNAIADRVFSKHQVPVIDLYTFTRKFGDDRFADHAHYIPRVIDAQAVYIAGFLKQWGAKTK